MSGNARKKNDKLASASQRSGKRFSSPYYGVSWHRSSQRWAVQIRHGGRRLHVGYFVDEVEAAKGFDEVARQLRGPDARTNFNSDGILCEEVTKLLRGESVDKYPSAASKSRKRRRPAASSSGGDGAAQHLPKSAAAAAAAVDAVKRRRGLAAAQRAAAAGAATAAAAAAVAAAPKPAPAAPSLASLTLPPWPSGMSGGAPLDLEEVGGVAQALANLPAALVARAAAKHALQHREETQSVSSALDLLAAATVAADAVVEAPPPSHVLSSALLAAAPRPAATGPFLGGAVGAASAPLRAGSDRLSRAGSATSEDRRMVVGTTRPRSVSVSSLQGSGAGMASPLLRQRSGSMGGEEEDDDAASTSAAAAGHTGGRGASTLAPSARAPMDAFFLQQRLEAFKKHIVASASAPPGSGTAAAPWFTRPGATPGS